jgi:glycosyltransferase involved in cell wall biosynthesis
MFVPPADGGMAQYARELLTALAEQPGGGYQYELVTSRDLDPQLAAAPYAVHAILPPLLHRGRFRTRAGWVASRLTHYHRRDAYFLRWLEARPDVDAVHFQELTPWGAPRLFGRIRGLGKRIFYTVHNVRPHRYPALTPRWLIDRCRRRTCMRCDGLFVHTQALADQLSDFLGGSHPPIHIVPHGVWNVGAGAERPPLEERLKWNQLLFFGAIRRNKGLHLLLDALASLPEFGLTIAGEPLEKEYYRSEILPRIRQLQSDGARIDLRDHWTPDNQIAGLFSSHSAVVMPYTSEFVAQSGVLFMALAYEVPVVSSRAGGLGDFLRQFKVGVTFEWEEPAALAAAVQALHAADARELSREIQAARRRYSWRQAAAATVAGYSLTQTPVDAPVFVDPKHDCTAQTISAA